MHELSQNEHDNSPPSYRGEIFIDIPYDSTSPDYRELADFLEDEEENARIPGTQFCYLPLDSAIQNQARIDPNWVENF